MKDKIKKFVKEHQETITTIGTGLMLGLAGIAYHHRQMTGMEIGCVRYGVDPETNENVGVNVYHKNGLGTSWDFPKE